MKLPTNARFIEMSNGDLQATWYDPVKGFCWKHIRTEFSGHFPKCNTISKVKAALREGPYTSLGGYPVYFITKDCGVLSYNAVESEFATICHAMMHDDDPQWQIVALEVNYEDELTCDHTGVTIESAYGDD